MNKELPLLLVVEGLVLWYLVVYDRQLSLSLPLQLTNIINTISNSISDCPLERNNQYQYSITQSKPQIRTKIVSQIILYNLYSYKCKPITTFKIEKKIINFIKTNYTNLI